jgi:hypothetical protein
MILIFHGRLVLSTWVTDGAPAKKAARYANRNLPIRSHNPRRSPKKRLTNVG